jgi:hypothetical protein
VDELGGLLFKAQGPLGLEALGLAKLKGKIAGKNAQEVMYNFANIASTDFIAGGTGKDPVVLSPLPAQLTLSQTIGVQTPFGKVSVLAREHTFFGHDTGSAHTLIVAEIKRAGPQTSMQYTSVQNRSALELALNEAAGWVHSSSTISSLPGFKPATVQLTQGDNNVISMQRWMSNGTEGKLVSVSINDGRGAGFTEVPPSVFNALPDGLRTDVSREGGTQYAQRTGQLERNGRMVTVTYWQATYVRQNSQGQKEVVTKVFTPGDNQLAVTITRSPDGSFVYNWVPGNNGRLPGGRSNLSVPQGGRLSYSDNGNRADVVNSAGTQRDKYTRVGDGDYELVRRSEHLLYDGRSTDLRLVYKAKENIYQLVRERANRPEQVVADRLKVGPDGKPILPLEALGGLDVRRLETPSNWFAVAPSATDRTAPNEKSIPMRILDFFKGFGLEAWDTILALGDVARLLNDANPLALPGSMLAELIITPITGKSPEEAVKERGEKFIKASKALLDQVVAVLKLAWDLSTPVLVTNTMIMANNMVRDALRLLNRGELTAGAVSQIIAARTGQNPSLQAVLTVLDSFTNYKEVLRTGGDAEEIGRAAFRIFSTFVDFAKPSALGRTATVVDQVVIAKPLQQLDLLNQLDAPGKSVVVLRENMTLENLAQLTKEKNREFALLTKGNERMLIAGDAVSVPLTPEQMRQLSERGWKLTAHSHLSGLTPSAGDANVLAATPQTRSIIVTGEGGRVSYTVEQGVGGRPDRISTGAKTLQQAQEAAMTLRAGGVIDYIDPIFQNVRANGLGRVGQYNLDGATTMRDVARRNTSLYTGGNTLNATPHDITHATMAGAGGHMNNTVYPDGVNGILVMADNFTMREFMLTYGGDVKKVDFGKYVQDNYLIPAIDSDPGKLMGTLQREMDDAMARFEANDLKRNPSLRPQAVEQTVRGARSLVETSEDHGFLNYANYRYEGIPARGGPNTNIDTPRSLALKEAADAAWQKITDGYKTQNRALTAEGIEDLRELQMREMISNIVPKEQAAMALKDHITYHELLAQQYMATYPGTTKGDYYNKLSDRFNARNVILDLRVPTRQEFETKRRELFPNG